MTTNNDAFIDSGLIHIESDDRLVVLARTIDVEDGEAEAALKDRAVDWSRFGETCLGQALYRHRSVYQNASTAPVWSHLELSYFRHLIPAESILELVTNSQPIGMRLLRAEILLPTPSSFILPRNWQGFADRNKLQASLEFLDVKPAHLNEYRAAMRDYCGLAATKLVQSKEFGTFRAMETASVLYQDSAFSIDWNQLHLCELNPDGFEGFGKAFGDALRDDLPDSAELSDTVSSLGRIRTVPRWTFNDAIVEADEALGSLRG
jgi:hypothetical protein